MTADERPPLSRSLATIGMAVCGPVTLFTGFGVVATAWAGTPRALMAVFLAAASGTALFTLVYLAADIRERAGPDG
jgi:hypothetical protein